MVGLRKGGQRELGRPAGSGVWAWKGAAPTKPEIELGGGTRVSRGVVGEMALTR